MPQNDPTLIYKDDSLTYQLKEDNTITGIDTLPPEVQKAIRETMTHAVPVQQNNNPTTGSDAPMYIFLLVLIIGIIARFRSNLRAGKFDNESAFGDDEPVVKKKQPYLTYYGDQLDFSDEVLNTVLTKHFPYYLTLSIADKEKFLYRLKKFIADKTFKIHDESAFREMPILISATAIQLSFGLKEYLLPQYQFIHIYPEEFLRTDNHIRFLEGNVSGKSINLSWKHFLKGFQYPDDGQNVGLHEMAHAYYYQNFETGEDVDKKFVQTFDKFNDYGNKAFEEEQLPYRDLYSDYAMSNFQEFWAESVEIFFEKPSILKIQYPQLYSAISDLLNQDPAGNA